MSISDADRQVVESLFKAMQAGPDGEEAMMALFADDAALTEPFSGEPRNHQGIDAIRNYFASLEDAGKATTTVASYKGDLALALDGLGAETLVGDLNARTILPFPTGAAPGTPRMPSSRSPRNGDPQPLALSHRVCRYVSVARAVRAGRRLSDQVTDDL